VGVLCIVLNVLMTLYLLCNSREFTYAQYDLLPYIVVRAFLVDYGIIDAEI
jgi:hypothetical protein